MWLILSLSSLSIKACLYALSKLVSSSSIEIENTRSSRVWTCKSLLCTHKAKSKWGYSCHPRERGLFPSQQALQDLCSWLPSQRRIWHQNNGCILLCYISIIDDYHYGSTLIVLWLMLSYIFSDWYIIASTRFYACIRVVLCVCRCPITEIVGIVTGRGKGIRATSLLRTLVLESK